MLVIYILTLQVVSMIIIYFNYCIFGFYLTLHYSVSWSPDIRKWRKLNFKGTECSTRIRREKSMSMMYQGSKMELKEKKNVIKVYFAMSKRVLSMMTLINRLMGLG